MKKEYKLINGQHDPTRSKWRKYDYLVKDLPVPVTQSLWHKLDWDSFSFIKDLTEEDEGFLRLRDVGMSDNQITKIKGLATEYFKEVNEMMNQVSRPPLYPYPEDAVGSSKTHLDLLKLISYDEVVEFYGCEYPDYVPLRCNDGILELKKEKAFYSFDGREYVFIDKNDDLLLVPYRSPWLKVCVLHNAFSVNKLLEDNSITLSNGKTYSIDSFCKLLATAILNKQIELDLLEP